MAYIYQLNSQPGAGNGLSNLLESRLQLGNEEWMRPLNITAGGFLGIKVGIRFAFTGIGKIMNAGLHLGFLAGINRPMRHPNGPVEFLGVSVFNAVAATGGMDSGTPTYTNAAVAAGVTSVPYYAGTTSVSPKLFSVIGLVPTPLTTLAVTVNGGATYPYSAPQMLAFDLLKTATNPITGATTWSFTPCAASITPTTAFCSHADFYFNMEATASWKTPSTATPVTTASLVHAGPGLFDTLTICWNKSCPVLDIFDVAVLRTA
jgi:hypothetical protein